MIRLLLALMTALSSVPSFAQEGGRLPRGERGGDRGGDRGGHRELPRREVPREVPRRELPREQPRREVPREQPRQPRQPLPQPGQPAPGERERREERRRQPGQPLPQPGQPDNGQQERERRRREEERRRRQPGQPLPNPGQPDNGQQERERRRQEEERRRRQPGQPTPGRPNPGQPNPGDDARRREEQRRREERRREERRRRAPGDGRARPDVPRQRPPVVVDPGPRQPGRRLPRPARPDSHIDGRREHDREVNFPRHPGHNPHQDRWGRRLPPSRDHITVINNTTIINNVRYHERNWDRRHGHGYNWHNWNGHRVCHHYDRYNRHWWGFYIGSVYFWTRYHNDYYWWYDPYYRRWVYMHEGRWWYRDPANVTVVYVYDNGRYYDYRDSRGGVVLVPDPTPPAEPVPTDPAAPTAPETDKEVYVSEDGTREVRIVGEERDAFLYDTAETPSFEPEYLASNVKEVVFNSATDGALQIMLVVEKTANGQTERSFRVFDAQGNDLLAPETPDERSLREGSGAFRELEAETESTPQ